MRLQNLAAMMAAAALILAAWCAWEVRALQERTDWIAGALRAQSDQTGSSAPAGDVEARLKQLEAAVPGLGELMSGLQIHIAKLYFAAQAGNWPLARFETGEMEKVLASVPVVRSEENGVPLGAVIDAFKNSQWAALKDTVDRHDLAAFDTAYTNVVFVCNACHEATGHPYLQITAPTQPPVPNQLWKPAPPVVRTPADMPRN
jgi:hypothetical protein